MRKLAPALLALPVVVGVYLRLTLRRSIAARVGLALGVGATLGLAGLGLLSPPRIGATPPDPVRPLASSAFTAGLRVDQPLDAVATLSFSVPMDPASVAAALSVDPVAQVRLAWDAADRTLTVSPAGAWSAATYYTVTVGTSARDARGRPLETPARSIFVTRAGTTARLFATDEQGDSVGPDTAFVVAFDRPVPADAARASFRIEPAVSGAVMVDGTGALVTRVTFTPGAPLPAGARYRISIAPGLSDAEGGPVALPDPLVVRTSTAPEVVRFRPRAGASDVARSAAVSVRFSEPMDRAATAAAFTVSAGGTPVTKGATSWAEGDTVLVFEPSAAFDYSATVVLSVGSGAKSAHGVAIATPASATFTVEPKPAPPAATTAPKPSPKPIPKSAPSPVPTGGGSVGGGSWAAVETYYLKLMNCTRTGGWVHSDGTCTGAGSRDVAPLVLDAGISTRVSRPYAKYLATHDICSHFVGGTPGDRLSRAGYTSYRWAENLGCYPANPFTSVLETHLYFQSERPYNGGHWVNMMNAAYDRVGIGVWASGSTVRLVIDFYHP